MAVHMVYEPSLEEHSYHISTIFRRRFIWHILRAWTMGRSLSITSLHINRPQRVVHIIFRRGFISHINRLQKAVHTHFTVYYKSDLYINHPPKAMHICSLTCHSARKARPTFLRFQTHITHRYAPRQRPRARALLFPFSPAARARTPTPNL